MLGRKNSNSLVGLDIDAGSIAATELGAHDTPPVATAVGPLDAGAFSEGEVTDPALLADALGELFSAHRLSRRVRLGVANQRVVVRTLRLPAIEDPEEFGAAVRFQAQEEFSMPLEQAVLEHQVVGGTPADNGAPAQVDVVVVAARRDMIEAFLEPIRRAGLQPVAIDLSAFAMIRALANGASAKQADGEEETVSEAQEPVADSAALYCCVGANTNLAVASGSACLFTRVSQFGLESVARELASERELSTEHARRWLVHVGLEKPVEELEGDAEIAAAARAALENGAAALLNELRLSLEYYGAQGTALPVDRVVLSGPGSAIPGLSEKLESGLALPLETGRPAALGQLDDESAARLTLSYGLALGG